MAAAAQTEAQHAQQTLAAQAERDAATLDALLAELDPVMCASCGDGWQTAWRADPAGWHRDRSSEAQAWAAQSAQLLEQRAALGAIEANAREAGVRAEHAAQAASAAQEAYARSEAALRERRVERAGLFEGRAVQDVEASLRQRLTAAREALAARQLAANEAAQQETRIRAGIAQAGERIATLLDDARDAAARLGDWIEDYAARHADLEPVENQAALAALLAVGAQWVSNERTALGEVDGAVARAAAVLAERRNQRALHEASADPSSNAQDADAVTAALHKVLE